PVPTPDPPCGPTAPGIGVGVIVVGVWPLLLICPGCCNWFWQGTPFAALPVEHSFGVGAVVVCAEAGSAKASIPAVAPAIMPAERIAFISDSIILCLKRGAFAAFGVQPLLGYQVPGGGFALSRSNQPLGSPGISAGGPNSSSACATSRTASQSASRSVSP